MPDNLPQNNPDEGVDFSQYFNKPQPPKESGQELKDNENARFAGEIPKVKIVIGKKIILLIGILAVLVIAQLLIFYFSLPPAPIKKTGTSQSK